MDHKWVVFAEAEAETREIEILRAGSFTDQRGQEIEIGPEDLENFVRNFQANAAGQDVPVDVNHERAEAAGWLRGLRVADGRLVGDVEWNPLGKRLVGEQVYRYISATIDMAKKVIRSASLVNFPAVKGLRPVELSGGVFIEQIESKEDGMDPEKGKQDQVDLNALREQVRAEIEAELAEREQSLAEMREEVRAELETELAEQFERRQALVEFSQEITGGEHGLAAKPKDVVDFLVGLGDEQFEQAKTLLRSKVVSFGEVGSSREGKSDKLGLPDVYARALREGNLELADLNNPVILADLGDLGQYDLSEFKEE